VTVVGALVFLLCASTAMAGGGVNVWFGQKDVEDAEDADEQDQIGLMFDFGGDWPISIAVDILQSDEDASYSYTYSYPGPGGVGVYIDIEADIEVTITELQLGVRKSFGEKVTRPYIGGGLAIADAEVELELSAPVLGSASFDESETGVGLWANVGVGFRIGRRFNAGIDVRYSTVEVEFEDEDIDVGGLAYGAVLGFRWGE
jgi:hypothetical protein